MKYQSGNRFVAHFDILGMSSLVQRDPDLAWQKLSAFRAAQEERLHMRLQRKDTNEDIVDRVRSFIFSDTLIAFSLSDTENDAVAVIVLLTEMFTRSLHYGIPLRGAITHGRFDFNFSLQLFSGPALIKAYKLGESCQWLGVVVDDVAAEIVKRTPVLPGGMEIVVPWDVPIKDGRPNRRNALNWAASHGHTYQGAMPLTGEVLYSPMVEMYGPWNALDRRDQLKYEHTSRFFNAHYRR